MTLDREKGARIGLQGNTKVGTNFDERGENTFAIKREASAKLRTREKTPRARLETNAIAGGNRQREFGSMSVSTSPFTNCESERERWA